MAEPFESRPSCRKCQFRDTSFRIEPNIGLPVKMIYVTCGRCGHSWEMETADLRPEKPGREVIEKGAIHGK